MQFQNRYHLRKFFTALAAIVIFNACSPYEGKMDEYEEKDKTVFVYMIANNNLSDDAFINISQMESGYIPNQNQNNLVIYSHTANANPKLIHLYKNRGGDIIRDTVYNFPSRNSATDKSLTDALNVVKTMFPAKERGLVLWSHGTGWLPEGYYNLNGTKEDVSNAMSSNTLFDGSNNGWPTVPSTGDPYADLVKSFGSESNAGEGTKEINIDKLNAALPYKLDFIIFDACFMGGIENFYELKDSTDYIVGSAAEVLAEGLCYNSMMEHLFSEPTDLVGMAESAYNYYNNKVGSQQSITISVVKCSELENVAKSAATIFEKYRDNIPSLNVHNIQGYFRYSDYWFYDINEFIKSLAPSNEAAEFTSMLNRAIIYKATTGKMINITINPAKFSGVNTYIPLHPKDNTLENYYRTLKWEKAVNMLGDPNEE